MASFSFIVYHRDTGKILRRGITGRKEDLELQSQADYEITKHVPNRSKIDSKKYKVVESRVVNKTQEEIDADTKPPPPKYAHILDSEWRDILARVSALDGL